MRVLFSTGALYGFPPTAALRLACAAGCDGVELVLDPWTIALGGARVRRLAAAYGLTVPVLHPSLFALPGWHGSPAAFTRIALYAAAVGSTKVVLHPPRPTQLALMRGGFDRGLEAMRSAVGDAVRPVLENVAVFEASDIEHYCVWPAQVARFASERGLGITFDTTHLASAGQDLLASLEAVSAAVQHVHLSDFGRPHALLDRPSLDTYFKHHRLPGRGDLDLTGFLASLARHRYDGDVTLELSPVALKVWQPWGCARLLRQAVGFVKAAMRSDPGAGCGTPASRSAIDLTQPVRT